MIPVSPRRLSAWFLVLLLTGPLSLLGQNKKLDKTRSRANFYYQEDNLVEAEELYKELLNDVPDDYSAAYRLGIINNYLQDYRESLRYYRKAAEINPSRNDTVYLQIGLAYKRLNNYRKARESFEEFKQRHQMRDELFERAELEIKGCDLAEESLSTKRKDFRIGPASFNSTARDLFPAFLDQRQEDVFLVYTSHKPLPKKKSKRDPSTGEPKDSDLYYVVMENDSTFGAESTRFQKKVINTKRNDGSATFTADGLTMYFTICNSKFNKNGCSIFETRYNPVKKAWGKPKLVEGIGGQKEVIINTRGKTKTMPTDDRQPMISKDGRTLFFVSDQRRRRRWISTSGSPVVWAVVGLSLPMPAKRSILLLVNLLLS